MSICTGFWSRRTIVGLASIMLVGAAAAGHAAEAQSEPSEEELIDQRQEQEQEQADKEAGEKTPQAKSGHAPTTRKKTARDDDVFRPSEEISEDFAVSFPVDI